MQTLKRFCASIFFVILFNYLSAQEKEVALDPVTVTASLTPVAASKTGRNLIVIKGDQISKLPVHSIDELLRYVPGLEVQSRGPMGSQSDLVIRGGTFEQVLVILDGLRINDPVTGHFNSYIPIAPAEIDRIEILKGAASAIYGSEAVGGVINVITKTFAEKKNQSKQQLSAQITGGQYGLWSIDAGGLYQKNKTAISAGVITNNSNGQPQRGINGFFHNTTASASINQYLNEHWQLSYRTSYDSRNFAAQNFYTTFVSDTAQEKVTSVWNQIRLAYQKGQQRFSFDAGYKTGEDHYQFSSVVSPNINNSKLWQAVALYQWQANDKLTITNGAQFINKKIESNDRGDHALDQAAIFTTVTQRIGENLFINPALRLDYNEQTGWELVPQINLSYRAPQWQLRGSAGKTIRDADFTERYNNYNKAVVSSGSIGNPDLGAERSFSYEAGADYFAANSLKISATFFQQFHTNLIDWVTTPYSNMPRKDNLIPTGNYALATNIATLNTTGVEGDIQYNATINNKNELWATIGLLWLDNKSSEAAPSFYISSNARFLTNFNIRYATPMFSFSINGIYKKRNPQAASPIHAAITNDYFVVNAKAEAFVVHKKLSLFAEADNVFDRQYSDLLGAQMPGRWLMGGVKISLSK